MITLPQKFHITDLFMQSPTQASKKQTGKQKFGTVIIRAYSKSSRSDSCSELSAQQSKYQLSLPLWLINEV